MIQNIKRASCEINSLNKGIVFGETRVFSVFFCFCLDVNSDKKSSMKNHENGIIQANSVKMKA